MKYENRLYMILHPNMSLVGSHYSPEQFARHYISGSTRHYQGKVIFAELDADFRHPFFPIDEAFNQMHPHEDGRPKATKFISIYRVLEYMDLNAVRQLYLVTPEAVCLPLKASDHSEIQARSGDLLRIYAEIAPVRMLVLSRLSVVEFGRSVTDRTALRYVPTLFYTQLEFDADQFLQDFEADPVLPPPIPQLHPSKLRDAILELKSKPAKVSKGLALDASFDRIAYRFVRHGFMFTSETEHRFFGMPSHREIERSNYKFWRCM